MKEQAINLRTQETLCNDRLLLCYVFVLRAMTSDLTLAFAVWLRPLYR